MVACDGIAAERIRQVHAGREAGGPVVYWMSREQRVQDNWALVCAQDIALKHKRPLIVVFCLVPDYPGANIRHYGFMLKGLQEVAENLQKLDIPFMLLQGNPPEILPHWFSEAHGSFLVTDFDPLRLKKSWQAKVAAKIETGFWVVDARNVVPCWFASQKLEYAAYTLRPKIKKLLKDFLCEISRPERHPYRSGIAAAPPDWRQARSYVKDHSIPEVDWLVPGEKAAMEHAHRFFADGLAFYEENRNDPNLAGQSNLSPYLHFGHIAPQRVALLAEKSKAPTEAKEAFLEELIVRRELADNFCHYNENYDGFAGLPAWAQKTLDEHREDDREYLYARGEFEKGGTHDELWNAAQREMVVRGKMHGYMRMYWAKKIMEWSASPEEAMDTAIYLNDRYSLDGRDPNGYAGIAWSIGGVHDRAWQERPVTGKVRYMSFAGCARKFDVRKYIVKWLTEQRRQEL